MTDDDLDDDYTDDDYKVPADDPFLLCLSLRSPR